MIKCYAISNGHFTLPESSTQTTSQLVQLFLHSSPQNVPILYNGLPFLPPKFPRHGGSRPHLIMVPWTHRSHLSPNGISIAWSVFAWLTTVTDRQTNRPTDQATRFVTTGRIYVGYVVLWFGLKADVINTTLSNLCSISNLFCYTFTLCNTEEFGIGLLLPPWFWEFIKTFKQVWREQICLFIKNCQQLWNLFLLQKFLRNL